MPDKPDAYSQWLGIRETRRPLNHYQILGLRTYEPNDRLIEQAFGVQKARLEKHAANQPALARQIFIELEAARSCLVNPHTKSAYDESLRAAIANQKLASSLGSPDPLASLDPPVLDSLPDLEQINSQLDALPAAPAVSAKSVLTMNSYESTSQRRKPKPAQGSSRMVLGIAIGAGVAAIIMVAGFFLMRGLGKPGGDATAVAEAESPEEASNDPETKSKSGPAKNPNSRALMPKPVTAGNSSKQAQPTRQETPKPTATSVPVAANSGSATSPAQPKPANRTPTPPVQSNLSRPGSPPKPLVATWEGLPLSVDLPSLEGDENIDKPVALGKLRVMDDSQCRMSIVYGIEGEMPKYQFKLEADAQRPRLWRVAMFAETDSSSPADAELSTEVATLELTDGDLQFRWRPDCRRAPAEKLCNAVLWVQVDNNRQRVQLRKCEAPMPLALDLEETELSIPFNAASLPPLEVLQLELLQVSTSKFTVAHPQTRRVKGEDALRLSLQPVPPTLELQMQLELTDEGAQIVVRPGLADSDGSVLPLTAGKLKALQRELPQDIHKTDADLAKVRLRLADLEGDLKRLTDRFGSSGAPYNQVASLKKSIETSRKSERELGQEVTRLQRCLNALPGLVATKGEIHNKSTLRLRVFFVSGTEEVHVLWM